MKGPHILLPPTSTPMAHHSSLPVTLSSTTPDQDQDRNRIPTEGELPGLRSLAENLSQSFKYLKGEMERGQAAHKALLLKQKRQVHELQETQSQIRESNNDLRQLEVTCTRVDAECARIAGVIHPIRRCPSDVLQYLFESICCTLSSNKFGSIPIAIRISSVCRRWRVIAIQTPRLWRDIVFSMARDNKAISRFWDLIVFRIKSVPATITLHDLELAGEPTLRYCRLHRIPAISKLSLHLMDADDFGELIAYPDFLPEAGTKELQICIQDEDPDDNHIFSWDVGALINAIPPVSNIDIASSCVLRMTPSARYQSVTTITLSGFMSQVDVFYILSAFTRLSSLEFHMVFFAETTTTVARPGISSTLRHLGLGLCARGEWWLGRVSFPNLVSFYHEGVSGYSDACVSFIRRHPSITKLELNRDEGMLGRIIAIAPQTRSLAISGGLSLLYPTQGGKRLPPPFPALKELKISIVNNAMSIADFEGVAKARCLPHNHPHAQIPPPLGPLSSFVIERNPQKEEDEDRESWRTSDLFQTVRQEISPELIRGHWQAIHLSWA